MGPSCLLDIAPYLDPNRVCFLAPGSTKPEVLQELADRTAGAPGIRDKAAFVKAIFEREEVSTTGIGGGIAVPHAKLPTNDGFTITIGLSEAGIDFAAKDDQPVTIVVMIAASDAMREDYLKVLASVAARLKRGDICERLRAARDPAAVIAALGS